VKKLMKQASDETLLAQKKEELGPIFGYLESELGDRDVLVGTHFSVADIAVCSILLNFRHAGEQIDAKRWPRLAAYHERHLARPSFKGLLEGERGFLASLG
jgi:glutathione S-transferase